MRRIVAILTLVGLLCLMVPGQRRGFDFTGVWTLERTGSGASAAYRLELQMSGQTLSGKLQLPYGEFPLENGHVEGDDVFFNVVVKRDEYSLKTTYRGHRFDQEIQFTVEAGERTLQMIGRRVS